MNKPIEAIAFQAPADDLCTRWGWENPSPKILEQARAMLRYSGLPLIDYLVETNAVTAEAIERALQSRPATVSDAEWISKNHPAATAHIERFQAWQSNVAYYDGLEDFTPHECMGIGDVARECEAGEFVALNTDRGVPVLLFGHMNALLSRQSLGRVDRDRSPVLRFLREHGHEEKLVFALSRRDLVGALLNAAMADLVSSGSSAKDVSWVFIANAHETAAQKETRDLSRLIDVAMQNKITDIDLTPLPDGGIRVLMRQYGDLKILPGAPATLSAEDGRRAISFLLARSGANPSNARLKAPADGHITFRSSSSGEAQLRLSFIPLNHPGELFQQVSTSIRILKQDQTSIDLTQLHLDTRIIDDIKYAINLTQGLILLVGPTNTGKSTTIAGALGEHYKLFGNSRKRVSAEDPIERLVKGLKQFQVPNIIPGLINTEEERWNIITKAIKRHDPDAIWLGEVRDEETARACITYAASGHLVFSTLHAKDPIVACDILARMVDPKYQYQLVESMELSVSQRLVKKLCPVCKEVHPVSEDEVRLLQRYAKSIGEPDIEIPKTAAYPGATRRPECQCADGYTDILPINESLSFTRETRDAWMRVLSHNDMGARNELFRARTLTMLEAGLTRVRAYETDLRSVFH